MLADQIQTDLQSAMKARDKQTVAALRMVLARIKEARTSAGHGAEVSDTEVQELIGREAKKREEAAATFSQHGRPELAENETAELAVLRRYLPAQLSDDELADLVAATIADTGASGPGDMGRVMGAIMPKVKGKASGNRVNALVKEQLTAG